MGNVKYHFNKAGKVGKCEAKNRCPLGGEELHATTKADAHRLYEEHATSREFSDYFESKRKESSKKVSKWRAIAKKLDEKMVPIMLTAAAVSAIVAGGATVAVNSTQDYEAHQAEITAVSVHHNYRSVKIGKTTTMQKGTLSKVTAKLPNGEVVNFSAIGNLSAKEGTTESIYQTGENSFTVDQPDAGSNLAIYGTAATAMGALGGLSVAFAGSQVTALVADKIANKAESEAAA